MSREPGDKSAKGGKSLNIDDLRLWKRFTEDIEPLQEADRAALEDAVAPDGTYRAPGPVEQIVPDGPRPQTSVPGSSAQLDRRTEDKLRKGKMEIEARIDLHGYTQEQAYAALNEAIPAWQKQGKRCVLVITGKGRGGDGVLRQKVPQWLDAFPLSPIVLKFFTARIRDGGEGALYVYLRRIRD